MMTDTNTQNASHPAPAEKVVPVAEPVAGLVEFRKLLNGQYFRFKPDGPTFERDKGGFKTHPFGDNGRWMPIDMNARVYPATPAASVPAGGERTCTCHPDDNPPNPCAKKYALSACRAAQPILAQDAKDARSEPSFELQRLRFFRDLVAAQRMDVFKALDAIPPGAEEEVNSHATENRLFNRVWMGPRGEDFSEAIDAAILSSEQLKTSEVSK